MIRRLDFMLHRRFENFAVIIANTLKKKKIAKRQIKNVKEVKI